MTGQEHVSAPASFLALVLSHKKLANLLIDMDDPHNLEIRILDSTISWSGEPQTSVILEASIKIMAPLIPVTIQKGGHLSFMLQHLWGTVISGDTSRSLAEEDADCLLLYRQTRILLQPTKLTGREYQRIGTFGIEEVVCKKYDEGCLCKSGYPVRDWMKANRKTFTIV